MNDMDQERLPHLTRMGGDSRESTRTVLAETLAAINS